MFFLKLSNQPLNSESFFSLRNNHTCKLSSRFYISYNSNSYFTKIVPFDCGTNESAVNKWLALLRPAKIKSLTKNLMHQNWKTETAKNSLHETKLEICIFTVYLLHYKNKWVLSSVEWSYSKINLLKMCTIQVSGTLNQLLNSQILFYLFV